MTYNTQRIKEKKENRLNQFRAAYTDLVNRMTEKHEAVVKRHNLATSNVQLTRDILKEYRGLKKEEVNLKQADFRSNLEVEKEKRNGVKE